MNADQLAAWMKIDAAALARLIEQGLPRRDDGTFDPYAVAKWLENAGLARRANFSGSVATLGKVATAFGVNLQTVKDWRQAGMPGQKGDWNLAEIDAWKKLRERDPSFIATAEGDLSGHMKRRIKAGADKLEEEAIRIRRQNRIAESNTLDRGDVERLIGQLLIQTRENFLTIPRNMLPKFPKKHARELADELRRELERVLEAMAQWRPRWDEEDGAAKTSDE